MKKLLITGGCGFVGRELVNISQDEFEVHVADNLLSGEHRLNKMNSERFKFHHIDLRDKNKTKLLIKDINPDIIVHLAAIHFIPQCENEPDLACTTNILATINLLECLNKNIKFIFTSSAAVYSPSDKELIENVSKVSPVDVYGYSKLHGEHYVNLYTERYQLDTCIVRLFNVIGPGETNPHILPEIFSQLKKGRKELNLGNIESKRDFIDVRDAAIGFLKLFTIDFKDLPDSRIVNLGSGTTYSMRELLDYVKEICGINFEIKKDLSKFRKVDNPVILASITKLEKSLKWKPCYNIKDTLKITWDDDETLPSLEN
ncbi:MAG: NAD(P)-dependent oxidoreductase [Candidatus Marinimicrobia bacterium]|nr:NAD(P)-dependent oxidoreductase [Candidatus Neomarinimicrobiota bacterium]